MGEALARAGEGRLSPLLKWVGSKQRLLPVLHAHLPARWGRLVEPFCGSAALFFSLRPEHAMLTDSNHRLIGTLRAVRDEPRAVLRALRRLEAAHDAEHYYAVRTAFNRQESRGALHAARFLYLNRTGYNGLYRENRSGQFNVPVGRYISPRIADEARVHEAAHALENAQLIARDYAATLDVCGRGDLVYLDPPYDTETGGGVVAYGPRVFDRAEQERLRDAAAAAAKRGAHVLVSNADTAYVRKLYKGWRSTPVLVRRSVSAGERRMAREVLITVRRA